MVRALALLLALALMAAVAGLATPTAHGDQEWRPVECGGVLWPPPDVVPWAPIEGLDDLDTFTGPMPRTVASREPGGLTLEWEGGPRNATTWQYRHRWIESIREPSYDLHGLAEVHEWKAWTDIPPAAGALRSYRVPNLLAGAWYDFQVRALAGTTPGSPSRCVEGRTARFDGNGIPEMPHDQAVEGGGVWRMPSRGLPINSTGTSKVVIDLPPGVRISAGGFGFLTYDERPETLGSSYLVLNEHIGVEEGRGFYLELEPGEFAGASRALREAMERHRHQTALFDAIAASARLMEPSPPELELIVVSNSSPDTLLLEWRGAPPDATGWQYREVPKWMEGAEWSDWTEIPGSDTSTRSYQVTGLYDSTYGYGASHDFQVRPVIGTVPGEPSNVGAGTSATPGERPAVVRGIVEGDGRTQWRAGHLDIVIPQGMRLRLVDLEWDKVLFEDVCSGSWLAVSLNHGEELMRYAASSEDCGGRNIQALFDAIVECAAQPFGRLQPRGRCLFEAGS